MDKQENSYTLEEYKAIRNKIDDILLGFDFDKVADVMKHLNWRWHLHGMDTPPSANQIRKEAYRLLTDSVEKQCDVATGGLEVHCGQPLVEYDNNNHDCYVDLSLKFVAESL